VAQRRVINFDELSGQVLVLLYERFVDDRSAPSALHIAGQLDEARNAVELVIRELTKDRYVEVVPPSGFSLPGFTASRYSLTRSGVEYVNGFPDDYYEGLIRSAGEGVTEEDAQGDAISIPASDRTVTLNHNQPDYQDAVAALDKVVEAFRDDHRLDNELGYEKGALLKALEAGRELLNDTVVNVRIGTALLIEPLQRLVVKYEKELVAALASAAIPLILKMFGVG